MIGALQALGRRLNVFSVYLFVLHHRAHCHCSHGVSRINWRRSHAEIADPSFFAIHPWLHDTAAIPFLNLGLKSKNLPAMFAASTKLIGVTH
ncbi:hypothetical protein P5V15_006574 [Pogonomyrmex californicus]